MYTHITYWSGDETQLFDGYLLEDCDTYVNICSSLCMAWLEKLNRITDSHCLRGWRVTPYQISNQRLHQKVYHNFNPAIFNFKITSESFPRLQQICLFFEHYYFFERHFSVCDALERAITKIDTLLAEQTIQELVVFMLDLTKAYEKKDRIETLFSPIIQKYVL